MLSQSCPPGTSCFHNPLPAAPTKIIPSLIASAISASIAVFLNGAAGKERIATKGRFSKGDKKTTYTAHPDGALPRDVIKIPALAGGAGMNERVDHPTQKPLILCDKLIRSCMQTDGYVLIPFAGSGSECVAAKKLNLPFVGIELNSEYIKLIEERLKSTEQMPEDPQSS